MYVSEIDFHVSPEEFEQVSTWTADIVGRLRNVPGCRQVLVLHTGPDRVTSYVTYDSLDHAKAAMPVIAEFFAQVAPYLTILPQRKLYAALAFEQFPVTPERPANRVASRARSSKAGP